MQQVNRGTTANDGTGESLFSAFGKVNTNFTEAVLGEIYRHIETVANKTYPLDKAIFAYTINSLHQEVQTSGTCTIAVQINGTSVTGLSAVSASTTASEPTASAANVVAIGDKVTMVVSSNSSCLDLVTRLKFTAT